MTAALLWTLATAALAYAPAVPYPAALQRHAAALAGGLACALLAARALAGRGFPWTPLPVAALGIAAALGLTAALPAEFSFAYSRTLAASVAAGAAGLCILAAASRAVSTAGLARRLLGGVSLLGAAVAATALLEAGGLDPLGAAPFYDSRRNPVATFGNPNPLVNFLTPCATASCALGLLSAGGARAAAFFAAALCAAAAGAAGVVYGVMALTAGLTAAAVLARRASMRAGAPIPWKACAGIPAVLLVLCLAVAWARADDPADPAASSPASAGDRWPVPATLEVRARIWVAALRLGLDFAPWGVGAGNFAIVFPTERDPTEIELSTHGRLDNAESAVDHAHNDFVQLAVEAGVPAVVALGALAVFLVRWRRQGVYTASPEAVAAASGLTSILVAALAHAPLYDTAASAILTALLLGILGSLDSSPGWSGAPSAPAVLARPLGVVVLCALPLPMLVAYRALRADILLTQERVHPSVSLDTLREAALLAPDDVHAVLLLARRLRAEGDRNGALAAFQEAKRRQLFLVEAILNIGVLLAERGDFKGALDAFQVCEDLDPGHPALRVNRRQLLLHRAEAERDARRDREAAALLDQAVNLGLPDVLLREWGNAFFELKEYARAIPYLDRYAMRQPLDGENWHKTGLAFQKLGSLESASLDFAKAHHLFALEHVRAGNLDAAARSAKQYQRWAGPKEAGPLVLEALLALRRGNAGEARAALDGARDRGLTLDAITWELADYAPLRDDPDLGPRVRKLVK